MFDSLYVGMTGLSGFSKGLRVISNNVANLNTPGFKGSKQQFGDLFYQGDLAGGLPSGTGYAQYGTGLNTLATSMNFLPGEVRQSSNALDVAIDGDGFFVLKDGDQQRYTRAGQFDLDKDGFLVVRGTTQRVQGFDAAGGLGDISLNGLRFSPPQATTTVKLRGNLSSTVTDFTLDNVKVIDSAGAEHVLKLAFKRGVPADGHWTVDVLEGTTTVASGAFRFADGKPAADGNSLSFAYAPDGAASTNLTLTLGSDATSFASGSVSSLAVASTDGFGAGSLTTMSFGHDGVIALGYSNGQKAQGAQLALARFDAPGMLESSGGNEFFATDPAAARIGRAAQNGAGQINGQQLELSNVDLSVEFGDLIVMQRGFQASSRIVSTANDMLQELFDMKGHR